MRLTELHEEWGWTSERAKRDRRDGLPHQEIVHQLKANRLDAEIRARVAAQEIGLIGDTPDAERVYPAKRRTYATNGVDPLQGWPVEHYPAHWTNHKTHAVPVAGCHLCREG